MQSILLNQSHSSITQNHFHLGHLHPPSQAWGIEAKLPLLSAVLALKNRVKISTATVEFITTVD